MNAPQPDGKESQFDRETRYQKYASEDDRYHRFLFLTFRTASTSFSACRFRLNLRTATVLSSIINKAIKVLPAVEKVSSRLGCAFRIEPSPKCSCWSLCSIFLSTELFKNPTWDSPLRRYSINAIRTSSHSLRCTGSQKTYNRVDDNITSSESFTRPLSWTDWR